jgi:hypothetical protein
MFPGCVERELFLQSEPPGATVCLDGQDRGKTPLTLPFEYYGTRKLELRLRGHKVEETYIEVSAPWYQYFPLDLFADLLWPFTIEDTRTFAFTMTPYQAKDEEDKEAILERAEELRYGAFEK